tara:strand:+ start:346 stop:507 length:162 start_codon:yes stop_codon:yes gene_type:complete
LTGTGIGVIGAGARAGLILAEKLFLIVSADKGFPGDKLRFTGETDFGFCLVAC